jgi:hypothetical protein
MRVLQHGLDMADLVLITLARKLVIRAKINPYILNSKTKMFQVVLFLLLVTAISAARTSRSFELKEIQRKRTRNVVLEDDFDTDEVLYASHENEAKGK